MNMHTHTSYIHIKKERKLSGSRESLFIPKRMEERKRSEGKDKRKKGIRERKAGREGRLKILEQDLGFCQSLVQT